MKRRSNGRFSNRPYRTLIFTLSLMLLCAPAWAITLHECTALTGGAANALDALAYASLSDTNIAIVTASQKSYIFRWNAASSAAENVTTHPYTVRADDDGGGVGRWLEATTESITTDQLTITNAVDTYPLDIAGSYASPQYARMLTDQNQHVGIILQRLEGGGSYNSAWYLSVPSSQTYMRWYHGAGGTVMTLNSDGDLWIDNDCSALTFTDRTPAFDGDALAQIEKIKPKAGTVKNKWGELDHDTLPDGVLVEKIEDGRPVQRRNLSNMVSLLTKAVQELTARIEALENK